jgi:hypothetical protein
MLVKVFVLVLRMVCRLVLRLAMFLRLMGFGLFERSILEVRGHGNLSGWNERAGIACSPENAHAMPALPVRMFSQRT